MFEVGEFIVHPGQGVCKVQGIVKEPEGAYMLTPVGQRNPMRISFPIENEKTLRPILSSDEASEIIDDYPTMELNAHRERSNALEEQYFNDEIRFGDCRDTVRIVKTFNQRIDAIKAAGKKPPVAYERILKKARKRSLTELSVALDKSPEDVAVLFMTADEELPENN